MIPLEGRVLAGLDEFMLRLGHLKVLCAVAVDVGGSWSRIEREYAKFLTDLIVVPDEEIEQVQYQLDPPRLGRRRAPALRGHRSHGGGRIGFSPGPRCLHLRRPRQPHGRPGGHDDVHAVRQAP